MSKKEKNKLPEDNLKSLSTFECLNDKQKELKNSIIGNTVTICTGIAGSGKSYVTLGTALELLGNKYTKIVMVKSVVTVPEESIGFIPGTWQEKMEPFMISFTGNIDKIFDKRGVSNDLIKKGILEVLPIAYVRGITQDNCVVILDESQNLSLNTFKTIITRIGYNCKYIILGDTEQIDRKKKEESCLQQIVDLFKDSDEISVVEFSDDDCVRNPIIKPILEKLRTIEK